MAAAVSSPPLVGLREDERDMAIVSVSHARTGRVDPLHVYIPGSADAQAIFDVLRDTVSKAVSVEASSIGAYSALVGRQPRSLTFIPAEQAAYVTGYIVPGGHHFELSRAGSKPGTIAELVWGSSEVCIHTITQEDYTAMFMRLRGPFDHQTEHIRFAEGRRFVPEHYKAALAARADAKAGSDAATTTAAGGAATAVAETEAAAPA